MARARATAQLLHRPAALGALDIVRALLAVQAQDLRAARLALRARTEGLTASAVDAALGDTLVISWLGRGTLHLVAREDLPWLLALTAPARARSNARRLAQEGVEPADADRAVAVIAAALREEGPLTRAQLAERVGSHGQATPHLAMRAALQGLLVAVGERVYATAEPAGDVDRDAALRELGRRYLVAHAPASAEDLAAWIGLSLRDARAALREARAPDVEPQPIPPRALGAFDPYLMGWKDRSFAVPVALARDVHPGGGIIRATATVDGVVVGTWRRDAPPDERFAAELADIARFEAH